MPCSNWSSINMSTESRKITVSGLAVEVVRKPIKNLHLGVYPPLGRVRVAAPLAVDDEAVRLAVVGKLGWIKRQQAKFQAQPRQSERRMVSGESHYFLGQRDRLRVHESGGTALSAEKLTLLNSLTTGTITVHSNIAKIVGKTADIKAAYEASEIVTDVAAGITNQITLQDDEKIELTDDTISVSDVIYINSKTSGNIKRIKYLL